MRVALRLLGLALLLVAVACVVLMFTPGPYAVAQAMGVSCRYDSGLGPNEQCTWWDAASLLWAGFWVTAIAGAILRIATRRRGKGPLTLDLRRRPRF